MQDNRYTPDPRKYYKSNYVDAVELITPKVYQQEDLEMSGTELNPLSQVVNSHIRACANISNVLSISGVANSQTSSLGNISGISQYFVKQNNLTKINPFILEEKILLPLGTTFANFDTSADFANYLSGTLLPSLIPATGSAKGSPYHNITTLSALTNSIEPSSVHNYLVDSLGWFYFLNTSADGGLDYSPSSYVLSSFNTLFVGNELVTVDGVKGFVEYIWKNYQTCSTFGSLGLIPPDFVSGVADGRSDTSAGVLPVYTSGTQRLENLQTLVDVVYSPLFIDQEDYTVKDALQSYMDASIELTDRTSKGPFRKFSNLLGFEFADISNEVDNLGLIYDIENAKDENLQYIAELIGWKLRGSSSSNWRHQLRKAVELYKKSGTMEAIQTAINLLINDSVLDVSGSTSELWESYLPFLIWYSLGTESPLFKSLNTWTYGMSQEAGVYAYNTSSLEANIHNVVDHIMFELYRAFPNMFIFNGERFPVQRLYNIDNRGQRQDVYAIVGELGMPSFHAHLLGTPGYETTRREAYANGHKIAWDASLSLGPLGSGVYMRGLEHPNLSLGEVPYFLSAAGDLEFTFTYRDKVNYPLPPFEEIKYYKDCNLSPELVGLLADKLSCFQVKDSFITQVRDFILNKGITTDTSLGSLNEMLMFFSSVQVPPNFDDVMLSISDYEKNLLDLWNGKSSHLFIDFNSGDFDFAKDTLGADGKNALYQASRVAQEFSPAHAIPRVNLNASASDGYSASSTLFTYLGLDHDGTRESYTSASILGNFEYSGVKMGSVAPGTSNGRGGLNTFKRADVDKITDNLLDSTTAAPLNNVGRRALRRRNFQYLLPKEGYYDRTGFNGPTNWDLEAQNPNLISYSVAPMRDPNIWPDPADIQGSYWTRTSTDLGSVSSVAMSTPGGDTSAIIMSGGPGGTSQRKLGLIQLNPRAALYGGTASNSRMPIVLEDKTITWSVYVKRAPTPALSTSSCNIWFTGFDEPGTGQIGTGYASFAWLSDSAATSSVLTLKSETTGYPTTLESVGDGWTRISASMPGNPFGSHMEASGIWTTVAIGDPDGDADGGNVVLKSMFWYAPQVEQWNTDLNKSVPTAYQPVSGASPDLSTYQDKGKLTLGYVPSAGQFYPVVDGVNPSGVWHSCENLESTRSFSGIATSATFPFRGLKELNSNYYTTKETDRYVDRDQVPQIYRTMHELFQQKALDSASSTTDFTSAGYLTNAYWKNQLLSRANASIASGLVLNSYDDYINFSFGTGVHKTWADHCKYFGSPINLNEVDKTGGNIFSQVFGKGLFNCDLDLTGYAATTTGGNYVASSVSTSLPISENSGSGVFSTCAVAAYSTGAALPASGSYIAKYPGQGVVPLSGTYILDNPNNAEFRNPNILSGIEFTDISGSPRANQFGVFKLDSSFAVPGRDNTLIDNTVIKCKSLGGLPRLRFNLKDYGDRANHFIKDHVFKLKVNALVGEENSYIMGGGRLGAWIHTEPEYSNNYFMWTSYNKAGSYASTENDGLGRITGHGNLTPNFPAQVADIPPGFENKFLYEASGTSALEMNFGSTSEDTFSYIGAINTSANVSEDEEYVFSVYARTTGYTNATSAFSINIFEDTDDQQSLRVVWQWGEDGVPVYHSQTTAFTTSKGQHKAEEVGNGWYRFSAAARGKDMLTNSNIKAGDSLRLVWYMDKPGNHGNIQNKKLRFWGPQMEVYDKGTNKALKNGVANPGPFKWVPGIVQPEDPPRYIWSWTPNKKWEYIKEEDVSIPRVIDLSHRYDFATYDAVAVTTPGETKCLNNVISQTEDTINNPSLLTLNKDNFETFEVKFDTRNFTHHNNSEYLDIIPIPEDVYKVTNQVNQDDTNYVVELFFIPNDNPDKYLLVNAVELQDVTQRENAALPSGFGVKTKGIPHRKFVTEDKLYLTKNQLYNTLKFYNGLIGQGTGVYSTNLASRDATITSGVMEAQGGSRLNYRLSPSWGTTNTGNTQANFNNFESVELDN
jgi:hypothetical protein